MYLEHFGFSETPFSIAPDPRYVYLSSRHAEAMAHLAYGLRSQGGGFVLLTGEVGTGKTTICRCVLESMVPESCDVAFIFNPKLSISELLSTLCDELHIQYPAGSASAKTFVDLINAHLLASHAAGRKTVLIIDEAQNLEPDVLEQLRLLTNLETNERKLLQIVLLGQPELLARLAQPELRQLAQRIIARYHLGNLAANELPGYIQHRLSIAGVHRNLFPPPVLKRLYRMTGGIPRLLNVICDRALLGCFVEGNDTVSLRTLEKAGREVLGEPARSGIGRLGRMGGAGHMGWVAGVLGALVGVLVGVGTFVVMYEVFSKSGPGKEIVWSADSTHRSGY